MAINYPGPFEVRLHYSLSVSSLLLTHEQRLNCDIITEPEPGETFDFFDVQRRGGVSQPLDEAVDAWVALLRPLFTNNVNFTDAELWMYEPESFEASFQSVYPIGLLGTGGGSNTQAGQLIYTFRTLEGGIMKISLMETNIASGISVGAASLTGAQAALKDFVISADNPWLARDTSYPFAAIAAHPGINEALFKRRFRNG